MWQVWLWDVKYSFGCMFSAGVIVVVVVVMGNIGFSSLFVFFLNEEFFCYCFYFYCNGFYRFFFKYYLIVCYSSFHLILGDFKKFSMKIFLSVC